MNNEKRIEYLTWRWVNRTHAVGDAILGALRELQAEHDAEMALVTKEWVAEQKVAHAAVVERNEARAQLADEIKECDLARAQLSDTNLAIAEGTADLENTCYRLKRSLGALRRDGEKKHVFTPGDGDSCGVYGCSLPIGASNHVAQTHTTPAPAEQPPAGYVKCFNIETCGWWMAKYSDDEGDKCNHCAAAGYGDQFLADLEKQFGSDWRPESVPAPVKPDLVAAQEPPAGYVKCRNFETCGWWSAEGPLCNHCCSVEYGDPIEDYDLGCGGPDWRPASAARPDAPAPAIATLVDTDNRILIGELRDRADALDGQVSMLIARVATLEMREQPPAEQPKSEDALPLGHAYEPSRHTAADFCTHRRYCGRPRSAHGKGGAPKDGPQPG